MEDKFKTLFNNMTRFSQQENITKARHEYDELISYQRQIVNKDPNDYEQKAKLGSVIPLITQIDVEIPLNKKISLYSEGINLFREIQEIKDFNLPLKIQFALFTIVADRGKTLFKANFFDTAKQDLDESIELGCSIKENMGTDFKPNWNVQLAELYVLRSRYYSQVSNEPSSIKSGTADINEAISNLQNLKESSAEGFRLEWQKMLELCIEERSTKFSIHNMGLL